MTNPTHFVSVTITQTQGSTPREQGASMLVSTRQTLGTIGGGRLEYQAIQEARKLLEQDSIAPISTQSTFTLGPELGQCCGGVVTVSYEIINDPQQWQHPDQQSKQKHNVVLCGAGHVGQALVNILQFQNWCIHWLDSRRGLFPEALSGQVFPKVCEAPETIIPDMPEASYYLVMTHDHGMDLSLCHAILQRGDFRWLGLIGSQTKLTKFRKRLLESGLKQEQVEQITCPIGIPEIKGKQPQQIALAVAAQLQILQEQHQGL